MDLTGIKNFLTGIDSSKSESKKAEKEEQLYSEDIKINSAIKAIANSQKPKSDTKAAVKAIADGYKKEPIKITADTHKIKHENELRHPEQTPDSINPFFNSATNPTLGTGFEAISDKELDFLHDRTDWNAFNKKVKSGYYKGMPNPMITVKGKKLLASLVVDKEKHNTFVIDPKSGAVIDKVRNATGKRKTPTPSGIRYITRVANRKDNNYQTGDDSPLVRKTPKNYGDHIFYTKQVDPKTAKTKQDGIYLHGTPAEWSIGRDASHGCVRHGKKGLEKLVKQVPAGNFIKIE